MVSGEAACPVEETEVVFAFLGVLAALATLPLATLPRFFLTTSDQRVALRTDFGTFGVLTAVLGVLVMEGESRNSSLGVETVGVEPLAGVATMGVSPPAAFRAVFGVALAGEALAGVAFLAGVT